MPSHAESTAWARPGPGSAGSVRPPVPQRWPRVVVVHRRQLPIASPCEDFVSPPGASDQGGFCERCQQRVHDVSVMRESELRRFLAARVGMQVCLAYRTDARGHLRLRAEPSWRDAHALALGALALLLAACAGHATELEAPTEVCRDEDGYAVSCPTWAEPAMHSVPEGLEGLEPLEPLGEGCPVRPTAKADLREPPSDDEAIAEADPSGVPGARPSTGGTAESSADTSGTSGTSANVRVDFSIDPDDELRRGMYVVTAGGWIDRDFVPTKQLWKQWAERRARQRAARARWRASRD